VDNARRPSFSWRRTKLATTSNACLRQARPQGGMMHLPFAALEECPGLIALTGAPRPTDRPRKLDLGPGGGRPAPGRSWLAAPC
jgi:hypothetical protein